MIKQVQIIIILLVSLLYQGRAQTIVLKDSAIVSIHPSYNQVSSIHKKLFGDNYRKVWSDKVKVPVIKLSEISGGLRPISGDVGIPSGSMILKNREGEEWLLKALVSDFSEGVPSLIDGTMYEKWMKDSYSSRHPFAALLFPTLAKAIKIPYNTTIIGLLSTENSLGSRGGNFIGRVCSLEKLEGRATLLNTQTMLNELQVKSTGAFDKEMFLKKQILDLLLANWTQEDSLWVREGNGLSIKIREATRNPNQALMVKNGVLPKFASGLDNKLPQTGFSSSLDEASKFFIHDLTLNQHLLNQYSYDRWMELTKEVVNALSDDVLRSAVDKLPTGSDKTGNNEIFKTLKSRRTELASAMDSYYRFLYEVAEVQGTDESENIQFIAAPNGGLQLTINSKNSSEKNEVPFYSNIFDPKITKEIRVLTGKGNDIISVGSIENNIAIRIIAVDGIKTFSSAEGNRRIDVYSNPLNSEFKKGKWNRHGSIDTLPDKKLVGNLYTNSSGFSPNADLRAIDGLFLGVSYKIRKAGFNKTPYGSLQKFSVLKSLGTKALIFKYNAEWISVFKNTDILIDGLADVNGNILNFFGRGNDTFFDQTGDFRRYYRVNFSFFQMEPSFRFRWGRFTTLSAGPSIQHFSIKPDNNPDRIISTAGILAQYPSLLEEKTHGGIQLNFMINTRDNIDLPTKGLNFSMRVHGYEGFNESATAYAQAFPQISFYKSIDSRSRVVLANRTGAGFTIGETAFYQSAFLGSQDNLLGFRKFRFAGDNLVYNNFEARFQLPNFLRYYMPGQIGLIGFYDAGRVWIKNEDSGTIHHGYGGGIYIAPLQRFVLRAIAGFSNEGMQATVTLRQRF